MKVCNIYLAMLSVCSVALSVEPSNKLRQKTLKIDEGTLLQRKLQTDNWVQLGEDIDGEVIGDLFGSSVSLSDDGTRIAIGATKNDGNGANSGHVRVYELNVDKWDQLGGDIDGEAKWDGSGISVSLSNDGARVAIGAHGNDGTDQNSGHVRVYELNSTDWVQVGNDIDGEAELDKSGFSVSLANNGNTIAIGATRNGFNDTGHVRVYQYNETDWNQVGEDIDGEAIGDFSGVSVSLCNDGTKVAIGARYNDGNGENSGHVRVYELNGAKWDQLGEDIDGEAQNDQSGISVSLSNDGARVAIGAHANDGAGGNSGHARVYEFNSTDWVQVGNDIDGEAKKDKSGFSVSLSNDGTRIAIGARFNDGNGDRSGHVRIYELNGNDWDQLGEDIDGKANAGEFGRSVSLSKDGSTVAIGAPGIAKNATNSGYVRVYEFPSTPPGAKGDPHFTTWIGKKYDFHGVCDLVLLQNQSFRGVGLNIHIRTKTMRSWSYIASVAINIGNDVLEIMGGSNQNTILINKVQEISLGSKDEILSQAILGGYPVQFERTSQKAMQFSIDLGHEQTIHVNTWNAMVSVTIKGGRKEDFGDSLGLMGTFKHGIFRGRDNLTEFEEINEFGSEWQVQENETMLFHSIEGPQAPQKCYIPSSAEMRRRLGEVQVLKSDAEIACSEAKRNDFDLCVFDVIATNDVNAAGAY